MKTDIQEVEDHRHQQLLVLVRLFLSMQKMRIGLQVGAVKDGRAKATEEELEKREEWIEKFQANEKELLADIKDALKEIPVVDDFMSLKGVSIATAAKIMAHIDIHKAASSPYRYSVYDPAKEAYLARGWATGRSHMAAQRKMIKMVLSHLWTRWRVLEGLPIREPYSHAKSGHKALITPEECGWVGLNDEEKE